MRRKYEKPRITSERVFSLTSPACDVNQPCPGICADRITYELCIGFEWKIKDVTCGSIPVLPSFKS